MEEFTHSDDFLDSMARRISHLKIRYEKLEKYSSLPSEDLNADQLKALAAKDRVAGAIEELEGNYRNYGKFSEFKAEADEEILKEATQKASKETTSNAVRDVAKELSIFLKTVSKIATNMDNSSTEDENESKAIYSLLSSMYSGDEEAIEAIVDYCLGSSKNIKDSEISYEMTKKYVDDYNSGRIEQKRLQQKQDAEEAVAAAAASTSIAESNSELFKQKNGNGSNGKFENVQRNRRSHSKSDSRSPYPPRGSNNDTNKQEVGEGDKKWKEAGKFRDNKSKDKSKPSTRKKNNNSRDQKTAL